MKVLLFCNKGFETMEFAPFVDVMGWARNDYHYDIEVNVEDYDALAIPGGFEEFGFYEEAYDERFLNLIREFDKKGKYIASICVGALPIGASGILKGRRATTYHLRDGYRQKQLEEFGVNVVQNQRIVIDNNVVTSFCPETAADVAFQLLTWLVGEEKSCVVSDAMGY